MRHARPLLVLVAASVGAQDGALPVPDADALAAAHAPFLDALARAMVRDDLGASHAAGRMLAAASDAKLGPAVRYLLCDQAERCARAADDVKAGLAVADARSAIFAVEPVAERVACLARFEAEAVVAPQVLVGARLAEAERLLATARPEFAAHLHHADRLATPDRPPGLAALVARETAALQQSRAAWERMARRGDDAVGTYRAFYRRQWQEGLPALRRQGGRLGRVAASKLEGHGGSTLDPLAVATAAEHWLAQSLTEPDAVATRNLQRRAMDLLALVVQESWSVGDDRIGEEAPLALPPEENARVGALLARTAARLAAAGTPGVDTLRFATPDDLAPLLVTGGEWSVTDGLLRGKDTGAATRASTRFAFKAIDSVTIRGGIRSADGLNFRVAVGNVNLLLNWEVADENHVYFGDACVRVGPRCLTANREHTIELRQIGDQIVVLVDGEVLASAMGTLAGTVSVYPAVGSEIFVRAIDVVGDVDLGVVVNGPTGTTR